jgi:hypothetical protein
MLGQIIGAAVLVLPLFAVPILLKKSLDSIPMIGQLANRWSSKANGSLSGKVKESYRGSTMGRGSAIRKNARESYRSKKFATRIGKGGFLGTTNQVLASGIPLPGAALQANKDLKKAATSAMVKAQEEEIADARKFIENTEFDGKTLSGKQRQDLAMGRKVLDKNNNEIKGLKGEAMQKAALQMQLGGAGSWGDVQEIIKASNAANAKMPGGVDLSKFSASISAQAGASGGKDPAFSGKRIDQISQGIFNYDIAVEQAIREGKYTAAAFAGMHDDARAEAIRVARAKESAGDSSLVEALRFAAEGVRSSPEISGSIAGNVTAQDQMQELLTTAPAAQTTPNGGLQIAHGAQQVHTAAQQSQQTNTPPQNTPPNTPSNSNTPPTP